MSVTTSASASIKADTLTPRQRFTAAMQRRPLPGRVPHFELVFFLTMEVFGKVHPEHRMDHQWLQMTQHERNLHIADLAQLYIDIAERYEHDAILLNPRPREPEMFMALIDEIRRRSGDRFFLMLHGDATISIPCGGDLEEMSVRMAEQPDQVEAEAAQRVDTFLQRAEVLRRHGGLDGFALCCDYCFNTGTFLPLPWFDRFITPYLHRLIAGYREMGFYVIKHTDGNIIPILDRLVPDDERCRPHALHSLDPQGGVDMKQIIERMGDKVALCGNVNCGLLQTGTDEQCIESARYALTHGMKAPGYVFCTSNCVYTGMELSRYELIREVWRREGIRSA
ncbi:MAG: hypothetical protein IT445_03830 [Phycisphaeraceae bacterium]|nr:hypothetical protein [Phycisphaeraceae bacterium]